MHRFLARKAVFHGKVVAISLVCFLAVLLTVASAQNTSSGSQQSAKLSKKEKRQLVETGVAQYEAGDYASAQTSLEQAAAVFPENYVVPYYLGLIYLDQARLEDTIGQWQHYVAMDPDSENAMKIRKYLTLLLRRQAETFARQAVANEKTLATGAVNDRAIAVAPFRNIGSANLNVLGKGFAAMLIADLSKVPDLEVVERIKLQVLMDEMELGASGLVAADSASRMGQMLGARHITAGSLADLDEENLQIASAVMDTRQQKPLGTPEAAGPLADFFTLEKQIACGIVEQIGKDCDDMPGEFKKIHTKSMPAMLAYSEGLNDLDNERYDAARAKFQQALDEDPDFDLAEKAFLATPLATMAGLTAAQMIAGASAGGVPSGAAGSAVAGGVGISTTTMVVGGAVLVGGGVALAAGGGGGGDGGGGGTIEPIIDISGDWRGTWNDGAGGSGEIDLLLTQSGTAVSGSTQIDGAASEDCNITGTVSGEVAGDQVRLTIAGASGQADLALTYQDSGLYGIITYASGQCSQATVALTLTGGATIEW